MKRLPYVDALRGYAILMVIAVHASPLVPTMPWAARQLASQGARGVQLFFVASALTLMQSWHRRNDGAWPFYVRRLFRIAPMFWLATIFFAGLAWSRTGELPWAKALATVSFLHGLSPGTIDGVVPGGWSIADEMMFYAIFPLLVGLVRGWRVALALLIAGVFAADAIRPLVVDALDGAAGSREQTKIFAFLWLPNQLPVFLVGILVFHAPWRVPLAAARVGLMCSLLAMAWLTFHSVGIQNHLAFAIAFGAVAFYLPFAQLPLLVNPLMCRIGKVSYSAYLWHFVLIYLFADRVLAWRLDGVSGFAAAFIALAVPALLGATVTYRLIELPMIRLGHAVAARVSRASSRSPQPSDAPRSSRGCAAEPGQRSSAGSNASSASGLAGNSGPPQPCRPRSAPRPAAE
jgi:exopolysaccharide production protein ExoZ